MRPMIPMPYHMMRSLRVSGSSRFVTLTFVGLSSLAAPVGHQPQVDQLEAEVFDASEQTVQSRGVKLGGQHGHARSARNIDIVERSAQQLTRPTLDGQHVMRVHNHSNPPL